MNKRTLVFPSFHRRRASIWLVGVVALLVTLSLTILISAADPPVRVEKEAEPGSTIQGESIEYTAVFTNSSDTDVGLLVISDSLPANFTFQTMLAGSDVVDNPSGTTGTIVWTGPYTVVSHSTLALIYSVKADGPASPTPYQNQIQASLSTGEIVSDSAGVTILGVDLNGVKLANPSQVYSGEPVTYTVALTNSGNQDAILQALTDTLPAGFAFSHMVTGPLPPPTIVDDTLLWTGPLTVGIGSELTFTYRVTATQQTGEHLANRVEARYDDTLVGPFQAEIDVLPRITHIYLPLLSRSDYVEPPPPEFLLAFDSNQTGNFEIWVINANATGQQNVSNLDGGDLDPTWSGDGTRLAWVHYYDGRGDVLRANVDGSGLFNLTNHPKDDRSPDWSPDSSQIVFSSYRDDRWEVYVMDADGSNQTRLTDRACQSHDPLWSPDGARIAFICGLEEYAEVYVMDADGSNQTRLTDDDHQATALDWSPDSTHLVFVLNEKGSDSELYKVNADTETLIRLTNDDAYQFAPKWSPDGSLIAYSTNQSGNYEIFVMNSDSTNPVNLTQAAGTDYVPAWSRDGSKISFISERDGNKELYVMDADGSNQLRLTQTEADEAEHAWQPLTP